MLETRKLKKYARRQLSVDILFRIEPRIIRLIRMNYSRIMVWRRIEIELRNISMIHCMSGVVKIVLDL